MVSLTSVLPAGTGAGPIVLEAVTVAWELDFSADDAAARELAAVLDDAAACDSESALALELAAASEEALDSATALALDSEEALALEDDLAFARESDAALALELVESFDEDDVLLPQAASNSVDVAMIVRIVTFFKLHSLRANGSVGALRIH